MNKNINRLYAIAEKNERLIIGLMSGTSLDGLDVALCRVTDAGFSTAVQVLASNTIPYQSHFKERLRAVCFRENIMLSDLTRLNKNIGIAHAGMVNDFLAENNIPAHNVDLIASHGQTVFHLPAEKATLQIGDADQLAAVTGIIVISDFRQKHIAGAGEGAPLAPYGDLLLFREQGTDVVMLNIGGIANFTYLAKDGKVLFSDTGAGNTLMDVCAKTYFGKDCDKNASIALSGRVNHALLAELKQQPFFDLPFPKTTGPELFNMAFVHAAMAGSSTDSLLSEDVMATLNKFSADAIIEALKTVVGEKSFKLFVSGGGCRNPLLMQHLKQGLAGAAFCDTEEKGIPPDAKEAVLFALLANECVAGDPRVFADISDQLPTLSMGKISFPG